eukprot:gb/GFBE01020893.1/.p1 GENE.gb/GFBE01020893.1/~~gb/GFBE01020893.1/.p1  ORF type:complete len:254 (+),score=66.37 gb/GFBE01020893.1/:1-762(+)
MDCGGSVKRETGYHVLVYVAMVAEASLVIEELGLELKPGLLPGHLGAQAYQGCYHGGLVTLVVSGPEGSAGPDRVGTVPASVITYASIQALKPDLVLNVGTAGGFEGRGCAVGDVFLATEFVNHDRRISLGNFKEYGIDRRSAHLAPRLLDSLGLKAGTVSTGNSLDRCDADMCSLAECGADVKDMEAAAIAWTAALTETPVMALKTITDIVDGSEPSPDEFARNLGAAQQKLREYVPKVIKHIMNSTSLEDL